MAKMDKLTRTRMMETMMRIRNFEHKLYELFRLGQTAGPVHTYVGEEAVAVGVAMALQEDDYVTSHHRGHGHCLARGISTRHALAEVLGRATGVCRGKGGSMHVADFSRGIIGANGIVGGSLPMATGMGLAFKTRGQKNVSVCFFGDGASNNGTFHEGINLGAIWKLPVIYICENNGYGMSFSSKESMAVKDVAVRAKGYGIPGVTVFGNDVFEVYEAVVKARKRAIEGKGPTLIEAKTFRQLGHNQFDMDRGDYYIPPKDRKKWEKNDPITLFRKRLLEDGDFTEQEIDALSKEVEYEIEEAAEFALNSPFPDERTALEDLYTQN